MIIQKWNIVNPQETTQVLVNPLGQIESLRKTEMSLNLTHLSHSEEVSETLNPGHGMNQVGS